MSDLKKLAEVKRIFARLPISESVHRSGDWVSSDDYDALQQEVEAYKRAKQENDERFMRERDEARQEVETLRLLLGRARAELNCLGQDLEELNNGTRHYPTALLDPELMDDINGALQHTGEETKP